jgi:large subunit ribosomal protein L21
MSCRLAPAASTRCPARLVAPATASVHVQAFGFTPAFQGRRCVKACAADAAVITAKPSSTFPATTDKYAIIDVGGVQHLVEEGRWYTCNRLKASPGDVVSFGRVLAVKDNEVFHVGRPYVEDVTVEAEIIEEFKGPKVTIYKMRPKKHTRKQVGHRQPLTKCVLPDAPALCGIHCGIQQMNPITSTHFRRFLLGVACKVLHEYVKSWLGSTLCAF